jgi:hypothetical protein
VISIDFVGPLPRTPDYFNYVLVVVDKFSKMAHFIPTTTNVTAEETARLLLEHVVRLHGLPEAIISDRGHEFTAHLFQEVWTAMGTDLRLSTAYHPQSDGQTERVNRELEQQLRVHANRTGNNWKQWLTVVEMHYNSDLHESTGKTPYEMNGVDWRDQWGVAMASARPRLRNDAAEELLRDIRSTWEDARQVDDPRLRDAGTSAERRARPGGSLRLLPLFGGREGHAALRLLSLSGVVFLFYFNFAVMLTLLMFMCCSIRGRI